MANHLEELTAAVQNLTELYQPVFGHESRGIDPKRNCINRLNDVKKIYDALSKELNRPLRVLDLGCNMGFFSLYAAKWGAEVTGIDIDDKNIRLCEILAREHPDYKVRFFHTKIEEFVPRVQAEEYDLVLCFSVLHWLTLPFGFPFVQNLLADLAKKVHTGLFEFALSSEFANNNLPTNYRSFLKEYTFIRVLSYASRHSGFKRPLCFASNKYVHFDELGVLKIDNFDDTKYGDTRFFICGDKFVKMSYNKLFPLKLIQREISFLSEFGGQNGLPKFHAAWSETDETGQRLFFARDLIRGITLEEKIRNKESFNRRDVIKQALEWMIFFEQNDYYFGDCLPKNWIYTDDRRVIPIDYEDMTGENTLRSWPYNVKLLFVMFMNSILELQTEKYILCWEARRLLSNLKKHVTTWQYEQIAAIKDSEKFFSRLYEILFKTDERNNSDIALDMQANEILAIEILLDEIQSSVKQNTINLADMKNHMNQVSSHLNRLFGMLAEQQKRIEHLEKIAQEKFN